MPRPKPAFLLALLILFSTGQSFCLAQQDDKLPKLEAAKLGSTNKVHRCESLYLTGQFTADDIAKLKAAGIKKVISLRTKDEIDWDEKGELEKAGIKFSGFPIASPDTLTDSYFDELRKSLAEAGTLMHCGSANRVGAVWLTYRVMDQGVELKKALAEAKQVGLRNPAMEAKALDYIKRKQDGARNKPQSVKPGINKSFLDPELDVDEFVKRFEIESREVYSARHRILAACDIAPGDTVADVGAGTGLFTQLFAVEVGEKGWVYAVDIAPRFLKHIQEKSSELKRTNITGVLCTENSTTLPPNSVDVVFICDTYHHFEYPSLTMKSIYRALKPDGHLIMIDFHRIKGKTREWLMNHVRAGQEIFKKEILDCGFKLESEKKIPGFEENYFLKFTK